MQTLLRTVIVIFLSLFIFSCGDDDSTPEGGDDGDDDTVSEMNPIPDQTTTFSANIEAIMINNCIECHGATPSNGAPMSLVTFTQVVEAANNRDLIGSMTTPSIFNIMPPETNGGKLPDAVILLVDDWIADGLTQ